jgi:Cof subfamily protein (haloacid dehalogenase superfamily)
LNLPDFEKRPGAVAIDLDGTLFNSRTEVSARNRKAILKCVLKGIPVIIATARTERSVRQRCGPELVHCCSLVLQNGAIGKAVLPLSGSFKEKLPSGTAAGIIDLALKTEPDARITLEIEGFEFGSNRKIDADTLWKLNSATPDMVISLESALKKASTKIVVSCQNRELSSLAEIISQKYTGLVSVVPSDKGTFLNIVSSKASKSIAIRKLIESQNITMDEVIAFGDEMLDADMLSSCGFPIAMANALPEIKALTQYQTANNDEDGVAIALEKMLDITRC